jgi:hypothetical protein
MRDLSNYEKYKKYIEGYVVGSSMGEYTTEYKPLFDLLHAYPEVEFDNDELNDIRDSIYKHVFFQLYQLESHDKNKVLLRLRNSLKLLTKTIDEILDSEIEAIKKQDDDLRDPFLDTLPLDEIIQQIDAITHSELAPNTIREYRKKGYFKSNKTSINVRSFAIWLKSYDYNTYKKFKENWEGRNKL